MLFFWIFFQLLGFLEAYHWDGNTMYDLEYQISAFDSEASAWYQSGYWTSGVKTSTCDGNTIMGGYQVLGGTIRGGYWERTYTGIPTPHNVIYLSIRIYPIDSWDYSESDYFGLSFDGVRINAWTLLGHDSPYAQSNICGNPTFRDLKPLLMSVTFPHTASSLVFAVINEIDGPSDDESLGFRDIKMEFKQISNPPSSFSFCGVTQGFPLDYNACPCAAGQYMTPVNTGICVTCDSTCLTCSGAGSSACVTCPDGRYKVGNTCPQCNSNCQTCSGSATACQTCPTGWFMVGTTCYPTCNYPLYTQVVNGVTFCRTPCPGSFVWWDGSCSTTGCSYSNSYGSYQLTSVTVNTFPQCNYPCPTNQYFYWNTSCIGSCPSPLTNEIFKVRNFCGYSCPTTQYLYWNGSCLNNCPWPLSPETQNTVTAYQRNFCWYYCQPGEFMYWNGSCFSTCPWPLVSEVQGTNLPRQFCWYTCSPTQFLYWNGSCLPNCPWPLSPEVQGTITAYKRNFCWYYCQPGEFMYWNGSCLSTCPSPLTTEVQGTYLPRQFCWYTCQPSEYLYWNGSCIGTCPWPLSAETQGTNPTYQRSFCWYYCQPGEFMYWNGSCISTCPLPLSTEVQGTYLPRQFCWYTCSPTQFLYWNGSCINTCPWPLSPEVQGTITTYKRNFCWYYCQPGEFMYWNGSCLTTCPSPLTTEIQGTNPTRQFCWYTCQPSEYLYWNGSCFGTCPSPLTPETQQGTSSNRKFCWYGCQPDKYLYWNGSCIDKCDSPLDSEIQGTFESRNFCWSPCQGGQYIYWNRSCLPDCPSPLAKQIDPDAMFCVNTCGDSSSNYLYSNQSCLSTCPSPLNVLNNPGVQYCVNPCGTSGSYLYENQTCLNNCSSPYLKRIEPNVQYCDRPCSEPNIYWYQNASCLPECKFPYVLFNYSSIIQCLPPCKEDSEYFYDFEKKCSKKCESPYKIELVDVIKVCKVGVEITVEEVEKIQDTVASIETQGKFTSGGMKAASAINSNNPASALLAGLSSMMQYIRYMKINYPPKVQMLFLVSAGSPISLSFGVNMPSFIKENLIDEPLPESFDKYDINSNFVSNLWDFMVSLVLILTAILVLVILKMMTFGLPKLNAVVKKVLQVLKWNFPLMMICGSSGDIFFYASLQLRSSPFTNLSSTVCCIVSIVMMILVVLLLGTTFKIVSVIHRRLRNQQNEAKQYKGFEILYTEYEEKSFFSLAYMLVFLSRGIIFNLTLAVLYDYPIVQCIIINVCNIAMICYVLYLRPLKELLALVQLWINEGLVNILSISVLILGILDKMGVNREATRVGVGNVILFVIKTFNTAGLVFMGIGMLFLVISIFRTLKALREKNIKSPFQMLKALIFGVPEAEKVNPVGQEEFAKKPKIVKPLRKEKVWIREENSSVIEMKEKSFSHLGSDNSHQTLPTHILQTELFNPL